jgi:Tol biopolymer transport system component
MGNRRVSASGTGIAMAFLNLACLSWVLGSSGHAAEEPPPPRPPGVFSEVGGWIAYGDKSGIWAADPTRPGDPSDRIQLSTNRGTPLDWSSDGSKLLILRRNTTPPPPHQYFDGGNLVVLNADGTETRLTEGDAWITGGSFSPNGSKVVYATWGVSPQRIFVVDAAGGTAQPLLTREWGVDAPTLSPDGSKIAYFGGERLRVMNADGSGSRVLTQEVFGAEAYARRLVWSPDGTRLAIDFFGNIYTIGADGSDLTLVIPLGRSPNWSPDGSRIAYDNGRGSHLEIADADGRHAQEFGYARSGPWNPLVQPEPEVARVPAAEGMTMASTLLLVVSLLALVAGAALIRRRMVQRTRP